ncbi:structure-specific endonuclease subunit SLX4 [Scheffersomyces coipomensis]|uniref:structure-specific endonuclease subunit SLX4 n=1 Tax=Scheffersomyces coipomensis TaxID=1788519 RepID=UPI00315D1319
MSRLEKEDSIYEQRALPSEEMEKDDDSIFFISTQMQSIHEDVVENEKNEVKIASQISRLKSFSHDNSSSRGNSQVTVNKVKVQPKLKAKKSGSSKKNQSMSSMVRDKFSTDKLSYFTGDQSKIDKFLKRIRREEELDELLPLAPKAGSNGGGVKLSTSQLICQRDWSYFLKSIKMKFPNLRSSRKRNLKIITRKIAIATQDNVDAENSLWSQAASMPDTELSKDDLKWLYDLDDEELMNASSFVEDDIIDNREFVLTLSQNMNEDEEVEFSTTGSPSQGIIDIFSSSAENENGDEIIVISDSESEVEELTVSMEKSQSYSQSQVQPGQSYLQVMESIYKPEETLPSHQDEVVDPLISFQSFPFADPKRKIIRTQEDLSQVNEAEPIEITSSTSLSKTPSFQQTPNKLKRTISDISPFKTPTKRSKQLLDTTNTPTNSSPVKLIAASSTESTPDGGQYGNIEDDEEIMSSDGDTVYSTARTYIYSNQLQKDRTPVKKNGLKVVPIRKTIQTTRHEVSNAIPVQDYTDPINHIQLKRVGFKEKEVIDIDEIIPDSEDDEDDKEISIVEITRVVEDLSDKTNTSILQVPSSPSKEMFSSQEIRNFLAEEEDESGGSIDFSKFTTTQLKEQFKEWGLKPVRGRDKMISILTEASKLTINSQTTDSTCATRTTSIKNATTTTTISATQQTMYEKLNEIIKSNDYWYEKIISYEPLILEDMQKWLESIGYKLEYDFLQKYCDEGGICCTNQR